MRELLNRLFTCASPHYFRIDGQTNARPPSSGIKTLGDFYTSSFAKITSDLKSDEERQLLDNVSRMFESALSSKKVESASRTYAYAYKYGLHELLNLFDCSLEKLPDRKYKRQLGNEIFDTYMKYYWKKGDAANSLSLTCHRLCQDKK